MRYRKLTIAEEKRPANVFIAQALAIGLESNKKLSKDIKLQVRDRMLQDSVGQPFISTFNFAPVRI